MRQFSTTWQLTWSPEQDLRTVKKEMSYCSEGVEFLFNVVTGDETCINFFFFKSESKKQ